MAVANGHVLRGCPVARRDQEAVVADPAAIWSSEDEAKATWLANLDS